MPLHKLIDTRPVWLIGCLGVSWGAAMALCVQFAPPSVVEALGGILVACGIALMILAVVQFQRHKTTLIPHHIPDALITTGVVRYSRNPIYLGDAMMLGASL